MAHGFDGGGRIFTDLSVSIRLLPSNPCAIACLKALTSEERSFMHVSQLDILRCPYCGAGFTLDEQTALQRNSDEIVNGILRCACTAYPIVDGIPVLLAAYGGDTNFQQVLAEDPARALTAALELDEERAAKFQQYLAAPEQPAYGEWLDLFCPGNEGPYFVHRLSNPTYLVGQLMLRAIGENPQCFTRRVIDIGGGSGHLVRAVLHLAGKAEVWLAETNYWKLWIARRIVAPGCVPICADAEAPLPFAADTFSLALCSDAFHYVWSKRMFASEMMRLAGADGVIFINHVHNALQENYSVGLPLAPQWWRNLFAERTVRVFKESEAFEGLVHQLPLDLSTKYTDEELADEQALFLIASPHEEIYRAYDYPGAQFSSGEWRINPLYEVESQPDGGAVLRLTNFPSAEYEDEYKACKRYLPAQLELSADALRLIAANELNAELRELADRYVLLNVPKGYL